MARFWCIILGTKWVWTIKIKMSLSLVAGENLSTGKLTKIMHQNLAIILWQLYYGKISCPWAQALQNDIFPHYLICFQNGFVRNMFLRRCRNSQQTLFQKLFIFINFDSNLGAHFGANFEAIFDIRRSQRKWNLDFITKMILSCYSNTTVFQKKFCRIQTRIVKVEGEPNDL